MSDEREAAGYRRGLRQGYEDAARMLETSRDAGERAIIDAAAELRRRLGPLEAKAWPITEHEHTGGDPQHCEGCGHAEVHPIHAEVGHRVVVGDLRGVIEGMRDDTPDDYKAFLAEAHAAAARHGLAVAWVDTQGALFVRRDANAMRGHAGGGGVVRLAANTEDNAPLPAPTAPGPWWVWTDDDGWVSVNVLPDLNAVEVMGGEMLSKPSDFTQWVRAAPPPKPMQ